jgi:hypothetical protein
MRKDQKHAELEKKLTEAVVLEAREWRGVMPIRNPRDLERTLEEVGRYLVTLMYPENRKETEEALEV